MGSAGDGQEPMTRGQGPTAVDKEPIGHQPTSYAVAPGEAVEGRQGGAVAPTSVGAYLFIDIGVLPRLKSGPLLNRPSTAELVQPSAQGHRPWILGRRSSVLVHRS